MEGISKAAIVLSLLKKIHTVPCHNRGHIKVMLVLQSCTNSLQVLPDSSSETFPTSYDCTYDVGNVKDEVDLDMQGEEEEVNVQTVVEECIDIKQEDGTYCEEEEDIDTNENVDVDLKEEVS
jgi:hypothetical protein